jgi:glycosyltransferase involved in cell wall biosynthesis
LVDVGDWKELAVAVERVIQDPELGRRLTSAGAEVCRQCEWTRVRENLSAVYGFQIADGSDVEVRDGEFALGD